MQPVSCGLNGITYSVDLGRKTTERGTFLLSVFTSDEVHRDTEIYPQPSLCQKRIKEQISDTLVKMLDETIALHIRVPGWRVLALITISC